MTSAAFFAAGPLFVVDGFPVTDYLFGAGLLLLAFLGWLSWSGAVRSPFLRARPTRHLPHQDPISLVRSAIAAPRLSEIARFLLRDLTFELHATLQVGWAEIPWWTSFSRRWTGVPLGRLRRTRYALRALIRDMMLEERERDFAVIDGLPPPKPDPRLPVRLEAMIPKVRSIVDDLRASVLLPSSAAGRERESRLAVGQPAPGGG